MLGILTRKDGNVATQKRAGHGDFRFGVNNIIRRHPLTPRTLKPVQECIQSSNWRKEAERSEYNEVQRHEDPGSKCHHARPLDDIDRACLKM